MHLELVELLRCTRAHADSVLVASSDRTSNRYVVEGALGCPECGAEYHIEGGVARFDRAVVAIDSATQSTYEEPGVHAERAMRVAAQLAMTDGRGVYALVGFDAAVATRIRAILPARLLLINCRNIESLGDPSASLSEAPAGIIEAHHSLPLTRNKFDGIAFATVPSTAILASAIDALKSKGRMVAPTSVSFPSGLQELVRDSQEWVATREAAATAPINITRR